MSDKDFNLKKIQKEKSLNEFEKELNELTEKYLKKEELSSTDVKFAIEFWLRKIFDYGR